MMLNNEVTINLEDCVHRIFHLIIPHTLCEIMTRTTGGYYPGEVVLESGLTQALYKTKDYEIIHLTYRVRKENSLDKYLMKTIDRQAQFSKQYEKVIPHKKLIHQVLKVCSFRLPGVYSKNLIESYLSVRKADIDNATLVSKLYTQISKFTENCSINSIPLESFYQFKRQSENTNDAISTYRNRNNVVPKSRAFAINNWQNNVLRNLGLKSKKAYGYAVSNLSMDPLITMQGNFRETTKSVYTGSREIRRITIGDHQEGAIKWNKRPVGFTIIPAENSQEVPF